MKSLLLILLGSSFLIPSLMAQETIEDIQYTYDAAGNREQREIIYYDGGAKNAKVVPYEEEEPAFDKGLNVYPNPTTHSIYLTLNSEVLESRRQELYVFDMLGKMLYQTHLLEEINRIDVSNWPSGNYILKLIYDNQHKEWIIVKN